MVLIWFALVIFLYKRLKILHLEKYKEMGEPSLFWNNSMKTGWATIKFLFKREHKDMNDNLLSYLCDFMLVFFALYSALFIGLFIGVFSFVPFNAKS